jgi:hypothetical protein
VKFTFQVVSAVLVAGLSSHGAYAFAGLKPKIQGSALKMVSSCRPNCFVPTNSLPGGSGICECTEIPLKNIFQIPSLGFEPLYFSPHLLQQGISNFYSRYTRSRFGYLVEATSTSCSFTQDNETNFPLYLAS